MIFRRRLSQILLVSGLILLAGMPADTAYANPAYAQQEPDPRQRERAEPAEVDTSRKVEPGAALLRSAVFPGWGQLYTGHTVKGGLMMVVQAAFIGMAVRADSQVKDLVGRRSLDPAPPTLENDIEAWRSDRRTWILRAFVLWIYSMADAYVDAHLYYFNEDEPQFDLYVKPPASVAEEFGIWLGLRIPIGSPNP